MVPQPDKFLYGAIHTIDDGSNNYGNYDDLGLNLWHTYVGTETGQISGKHTPVGPIYTPGWDSDDHLMNAVTDYSSTLTARIDEIYSHNNSRILWQRPKIEWLVFGQSSTYEAEPISPTDDMWFYAFNNHEVGEPETDNSQWAGPDPPVVLFCSRTFHSQGFAVRRLKANTEQSHRIEGNDQVNHWTGDSECDWYVKPRIRIPVSFPSSNPETPVCRVDVYNQNGYNPQDPTQNRIKSVDIKAKIF